MAAIRPKGQATKDYKTSLAKLRKMITMIAVVITIVLLGAFIFVQYQGWKGQREVAQAVRAEALTARAQTQAAAQAAAEQELTEAIERFAEPWWFQTSSSEPVRASVNYDPFKREFVATAPFTYTEAGRRVSGITEIRCGYTTKTTLDCTLVGRSERGDASRRVRVQFFDEGEYLRGSYVDQHPVTREYITKTAVLSRVQSALAGAISVH